jgi:hypothetical protein
MDTVCAGTAEWNGLRGIFWRWNRGLSLWQEEMGLGRECREHVGEFEKIVPPFSATMADVLWGALCAGFSGSGALSAEQSHGAELSHATSVALAGRRALALDSHSELSNEQPRLRDRMAFSAAVFVH